METIELAGADYKKVLQKATGLMLAYKPACPHCKNMKIVIDKFNKAHGPVDILQLDTEANADIMRDLEIEHVPTLFIIKGGEIVHKKRGLMSSRQLAALYNDV